MSTHDDPTLGRALAERKYAQARFILVTYTVAGAVIFGGGIAVWAAAHGLAARQAATRVAPAPSAAASDARPGAPGDDGGGLSLMFFLPGALLGTAVGYHFGHARSLPLRLEVQAAMGQAQDGNNAGGAVGSHSARVG